MTREELALYALTAFDLGDLVEIDGSDLIGEIVGMKIQIGNEDQYNVSYHDTCGNPKMEWWPASALESADEGGGPEPESNVVAFPCACEREDIQAAKRATRH